MYTVKFRSPDHLTKTGKGLSGLVEDMPYTAAPVLNREEDVVEGKHCHQQPQGVVGEMGCDQ